MKINYQEWKFVGWVWLIVVFLTFLPTIVGVITTPSDSIFLGRQAINANDLPVYYSNIEQVKEGHFLFKNLFTSEFHPRFIFDPFWLGVGILAKIFSLSSFLAFQLSKFLLIPVLLIVSYYLVAFFFQEETKRKVCFIFLVFASGLGRFYLGNLAGDPGVINFSIDQRGTVILPIDIWVPDAFSFFSIYNSPHFIASLTLIILIFLLSLLAFENYKLIYSLAAGLSALFLFQFHPYHLLTIFGVLGVFVCIYVIRKKRLNIGHLKHCLVLLIFSIPPIIYHSWTLSNFWVRQQHFLQNITLTPLLPMVLIGYGLLLPLALIGAFLILKKSEKDEKDIFLLFWFLIQFLLIYSPVAFQRRLLEGFQIVLALLATFGVFYLKDLVCQKPIFQKYFKEVFSNKVFFNKVFLLYLFFILFFFSNFVIIANDLILYLKNDDGMYLKKEVQEAMFWLRENTNQESVVLSAVKTGNLLPAFSLRQVYFGHLGQTAQSKEKLVKLERFFQKDNDDEKITFLKENKIDYLFLGPKEKELIQFNTDKKYLEKIFENEKVTIYKIKLPH